jgi:hypothetical protein
MLRNGEERGRKGGTPRMRLCGVRLECTLSVVALSSIDTQPQPSCFWMILGKARGTNEIDGAARGCGLVMIT